MYNNYSLVDVIIVFFYIFSIILMDYIFVIIVCIFCKKKVEGRSYDVRIVIYKIEFILSFNYNLYCKDLVVYFFLLVIFFKI